jgi:hypothetical protein
MVACSLCMAAAKPYSPLGFAFLPYNSLGTNTALGVTNTPTLTFAFWLMGTYDLTNPTTIQGIEFDGDLLSECEVTGGAAPGLCGSIDNGAGRFQLNFNNSVGLNNATDAIKFEGQAGSNGVWHHYLVSMDTVNQVSALYRDGVNTGVVANPLPSGAIPDLNNSGGFHLAGILPSQTSSVLEYQAEIVAAEASVVCTGVGTPPSMNGIPVTCAGANTIPPEVLRHFIKNGKPVNLGKRCQRPFGKRRAEVCIIGDTPANNGTGGPIAPLVQVASYGNVYSPPFGPHGIPAHQATLRWLQAKNAASLNGSSMTTSAGSMPIDPGDLIVIWAGISNSGGNADYSMKCPEFFAQVGAVNDTAQSVNSLMCYKKLVGGDTSGVYKISWNSGGAQRCHDWVMADYENIASIDQAGSIYNGPQGTTTHLTAAGLTTTAANETIVSAWVNWNAAANVPFSPPSTGMLRYRLADVGSPLQMMSVDEYAVPMGANPQRTMTTGSAVTSAGYTMTLVPN